MPFDNGARHGFEFGRLLLDVGPRATPALRRIARELDPIDGEHLGNMPRARRGSVIHTIDTAWEGPSGSGTRSHRIRLYTASRLAELCLDAGLVVEEAYDGFRDRPLTRRSAEMMLVARK